MVKLPQPGGRNFARNDKTTGDGVAVRGSEGADHRQVMAARAASTTQDLADAKATPLIINGGTQPPRLGAHDDGESQGGWSSREQQPELARSLPEHFAFEHGKVRKPVVDLVNAKQSRRPGASRTPSADVSELKSHMQMAQHPRDPAQRDPRVREARPRGSDHSTSAGTLRANPGVRGSFTPTRPGGVRVQRVAHLGLRLGERAASRRVRELWQHDWHQQCAKKEFPRISRQGWPSNRTRRFSEQVFLYLAAALRRIDRRQWADGPRQLARRRGKRARWRPTRKPAYRP